MDVENEMSYWGHWMKEIPDGVPEAVFLLLIVFSIIFGFYVTYRKDKNKRD